MPHIDLPLHLASDQTTIVRPHQQANTEQAKQSGYIVARVCFSSVDGQASDETKEYARRLVDRFNAHDALRFALAELIDRAQEFPQPATHDGLNMADTLARGRAALRLATGNGQPKPATKTRPAVEGHLNCYYSKPDRAGNCYFAFAYTDAATGKQVRGTISGGEGNVRGIIFELNGKTWDDSNDRYTWNINEMGVRAFDRMVKGWPHAGCVPKDLATWIKAELAKITDGTARNV